MNRIFFIVLILFSYSGFAQVINIESKRFFKDTNGIIGRGDLNFSINRNVQRIYTGGINLHVQYKHFKHRILAISDLMVIKAGDQDFVNAGYQHFRYNYLWYKRLTIEAFVQGQYNRVLLLNSRYMAGAGPRLKIYRTDNMRIYTGLMYLYEIQNQNNDSLISGNNRLSYYLTFNFDFQKLDVSSTTYFQPKLGDWTNYRIATDTNVEIEITTHFNLRSGINLLYDTRQPLRVPALTFLLRNGLAYKF
jgi:hypothetical protein